mmetsp:Transcript_11617/g.30351  ORF Transcript_11617/g.30351 Transcript_11617/m.30351 type:complete len:230 (+) Transcript_11617:106-795(+)
MSSRMRSNAAGAIAAATRAAIGDTRRASPPRPAGATSDAPNLTSSSAIRSKPSFWASGAYTSKVSVAFFSRFGRGMAPSVRMLCNRSANFKTPILHSWPAASRTAARFTASEAVGESVTPFTRAATSPPNARKMSSMSTLVSSTVSCKTPAQTVAASISMSARIVATAMGCVTKGEPSARLCPRWALAAKSTHAATSFRDLSSRYFVARSSVKVARSGAGYVGSGCALG